jgi:Protein of unknown function (DUF3768)
VSDENENAKRIAELNDRFRLRFNIPFLDTSLAVPGDIVATRAVIDLAAQVQVSIWEMVRRFDAFDEGDDPHGEHDFGAFEVEGAAEKILWKIDYYADASRESGSEDPSDITRCYRVLTIMLASDW